MSAIPDVAAVDPTVPIAGEEGASIMTVPAAAEPPPAPRVTVPLIDGLERCTNCGAALGGKYCAECGQRHYDHPIHHFWHFVAEAAEDLTHADSRLWRTLVALLFRPGVLTREFLEGRRARYLPPLRLYLVVSAIFFIVAGLDSRVSDRRVVLAGNDNSLRYRVLPAEEGKKLAAAEQAPAAGRVVTGLPTAPAERQHLCKQAGGYIAQHGGWFTSLGPRFKESCLAAVAPGGLKRLSDAVAHNLERAMFLLLPLLALVMKPLYLKPRRHYVEHLLFFLHDHAFVFVLLGLGTVLGMITSSSAVTGPVDATIAIYIPIYYFRAMRRLYGQGVWRTLTKLAALGLAYCFFGALLLVATVSYSFLML